MAFKMRSGKHEGKSIEWLFFNDPGYVWWMEENRREPSGPERQRLEALKRRARNIKVPGLCAWCGVRPNTRMMVVQHPDGGIGRVGFDCDVCSPEGWNCVPIRPGFFTPDLFRHYDKTGGKILVESIKAAYFGPRPPRMTQKILEKFFEDPKNFTVF